MSIGHAIRDHATKWLVGIVGGGLVTLIGWSFKNIVVKSDLENFAAMIGEEVRAEIAPLAMQQRANTRAICDGRRATLRAAVRDLKVELQEMSRDRGAEAWTNRDEALYQEWDIDLEEAQEELGTLDCR